MKESDRLSQRVVMLTDHEHYDQDLARKAAALRREIGEGEPGPPRSRPAGFSRYAEIDELLQARVSARRRRIA